MHVTIRPATQEDERIYVELACGLTRYNKASRLTPEELEKALAARVEHCTKLFRDLKPEQLILLAFADGCAVGYGLAQVHAATGYIDEVFVREDCRGGGIGKRLLDECTAWLQSRGATRLRLMVFDWNESAKTFYEKQGFSVWAVSMERKL